MANTVRELKDFKHKSSVSKEKWAAWKEKNKGNYQFESNGEVDIVYNDEYNVLSYDNASQQLYSDIVSIASAVTDDVPEPSSANESKISDLKIGDAVQVLTYGLGNGWNDATYLGKTQEKTLTQNEIHSFNGKTGIYLVTADELSTRVKVNGELLQKEVVNEGNKKIEFSGTLTDVQTELAKYPNYEATVLIQKEGFKEMIKGDKNHVESELKDKPELASNKASFTIKANSVKESAIGTYPKDKFRNGILQHPDNFSNPIEGPFGESANESTSSDEELAAWLTNNNSTSSEISVDKLTDKAKEFFSTQFHGYMKKHSDFLTANKLDNGKFDPEKLSDGEEYMEFLAICDKTIELIESKMNESRVVTSEKLTELEAALLPNPKPDYSYDEGKNLFTFTKGNKEKLTQEDTNKIAKAMTQVFGVVSCQLTPDSTGYEVSPPTSESIDEAFTKEEGEAFSKVKKIASTETNKTSELVKGLIDTNFPKSSTDEAKADALTKICGLLGIEESKLNEDMNSNITDFIVQNLEAKFKVTVTDDVKKAINGLTIDKDTDMGYLFTGSNDDYDKITALIKTTQNSWNRDATISYLTELSDTEDFGKLMKKYQTANEGKIIESKGFDEVKSVFSADSPSYTSTIYNVVDAIKKHKSTLTSEEKTELLGMVNTLESKHSQQSDNVAAELVKDKVQGTNVLGIPGAVRGQYTRAKNLLSESLVVNSKVVFTSGKFTKDKGYYGIVESKHPLKDSYKVVVYSKFNNVVCEGSYDGSMIKEEEENEAEKAKITTKTGVWYLTKCDTTHVFLSNNAESKGAPYHIGQLKNEPYYKDLENWLHTGPSIDGKIYEGKINEDKLIKGTDLSAEQKKEVLAAFVYRNTKENDNPNTRKALGDAAEFNQTDDEWIKSRSFSFTNDGKLSKRKKYAEPDYMAD